ncbi:MAG TPA: hypothetical protein VFP84_27185 [Kofleriaceae bacterium]|nr:hypothetical protein [Kofleriaceae bacterium]
MPIGWKIYVHRQQDNRSIPAEFEAAKGTRLAVWQTRVNGLDWIHELVKQKKAFHLGGDGYPYRFTAIAEHVIARIRDGQPPAANEVWQMDFGDTVVLPPGKTMADLPELWKTQRDLPAMDACHPQEWLIIVAWDES